MLNVLLAPTCFLLHFAWQEPAVKEKVPPHGWEYVRPLVEIRGQFHVSEKDNEQGRCIVRVGHQFGLQMFLLDWSESPELRKMANKLDGNWVLLTGTLKPPGKEYVILGFAGTVKVATFAKVSGPPLKVP